MAFTFIGAGAGFNGTGSGADAVTPHASTQAGDLLLVFCSNDAGGGLPTGNGGSSWVQLYGANFLAVYAARATSSTATVSVTNDSGYPTRIAIWTFRGLVSSGALTDVVSGGVQTSSPTSPSLTGTAQTTTADNDLLVLFAGAYGPSIRTSATGSGGIDSVSTSNGLHCGYKLDAGLAGAKAAPVLTFSGEACYQYGLTVSLRVAPTGGTPATASWTTATSTATCEALGVNVVPVVRATWAAAVVAATLSLGVAQPATAAWGTATSTTSFAHGIKQVLDDFDGRSSLGPNWEAVQIQRYNLSPEFLGNLPSIWQLTGCIYGPNGAAVWAPFQKSDAHFAEISVLNGATDAPGLILRGAADGLACYSLQFDAANCIIIRWGYSGPAEHGGLGVEETSSPEYSYYAPCALSGAAKIRAQIETGNPYPLITVWVNGAVIAQIYDTTNHVDPNTGVRTAVAVPPGKPGVRTGGADGTSITDFTAGVVPAPATAAWTAPEVASSAVMGLPVAATAAWTTATATATAILGLPTAASTAWTAASATTSASLGAVVSRAKGTYLYPSYAAFGGQDPYLSTQSNPVTKGRITSPGDRYIGRRLDIGQGDRVFFSATNGALLKNPSGDTLPVAKASLWVTPVKVMDYRYVGYTHPSGTAFNVRPVTGAFDPATSDGMAATLGTTATTVAAVPTWPTGGYHYDPTQKMAVPDPIEIDITSLYNDALAASADLNVCLECVFTDTHWVAEFFGSEVPELQPRIEVQRLASTAATIVIDSPVSAATKLTVTPPAGATVARIQWGYDEQLTQPGGVRKYSTIGSDQCPLDDNEGFSAQNGVPSTRSDQAGAPGPWQPTPGEGQAWNAGGDFSSWWMSVPSTWVFPMFESCTRVFVEVEVDFGAAGSQVFKRTFRVPDLPAPKIEIQPSYYQQTTWADVRGPVLAPHNATGQAWYALARKLGDPGHWYLYWMGEPDKRWKQFLAGPGTDDFDVRSTWAAWSDWSDSSYGGSDGPGALPDASANCVTAEDVSELFSDPAGNFDTFFLTLHDAGNGQWNIRLKSIAPAVGPNPGWYQGIWDNAYRQIDHGIVYQTTTGVKPNLRVAAITRGADWRTAFEQDWRVPLHVAFYADGALKVLTTTSFNSHEEGYYLRLSTSPSWTTELNYGISSIKDILFQHALTLDRVHRVVLIALTDGGSGFIAARSDNAYTMNQDGTGGYATNLSGGWSYQTIGTMARGWVSSPSLGDAGGALPDRETASICAQTSAGVVTAYGINTGGILYQKNPTGPFQAHPNPDWECTAYAFLNHWVVSRWPDVTGYTALQPCANGGADILSLGGTTLKAQSIRDVCMTSDESTFTLPGSCTDIHVQRDCQVYEGTPQPVLVGTPETGPFYTVFLTSHCDISRLDLPTDDQRLQFTSGNLTAASFPNTEKDEHTPGLVQRPGHNVFVMGWAWDSDTIGTALASGEGSVGTLMNHAGYLQFHIAGCLNETAKLVIYQAPVFAGAWVPAKGNYSGGYLEMDKGPSGVYQQEIFEEWPWVKSATWFYTYDAPSAAARRWLRLWQTRWIFDGECNGGAYILVTPVLRADDVWISHDPTSNPEGFKGSVAGWLAQRPDLVKWTDSNARLLTGVGPNAALPLSQTATMP